MTVSRFEGAGVHTERDGLWRGLLAALVASAVAAPAAAQDAPADTKVDASRGGITVSSGVNSLTLGARAQIRWTLDNREEYDADTSGSGLRRADGAFSQFDIPRLRMTLSGGVFKPWLRYAFQFDLGRSSNEGASKIKDALVEIRPVGRTYRIALGQFKAPFGLQQLTSSARLQFVDRAITDAKFVPSREMGVMVGGTFAARKGGYEAGVFNGSGESARQNNESALWAGRVYFDPLGPYALSEGALDGGDRAILHFGAAVRGGKQIRGRTPAGIVENADNQTAVTLEFAYRGPRVYTTAEYFWMKDEQNNPLRLRDLDSHGYHVQGGYMVLPQRVEAGVLWARIVGDTRADGADVTELRGGVNYFLHGHNVKLQADAGRVRYGAGFGALSSRARQGLPALGNRLVTGESLSDAQIRVQLQLGF